ncbi:MAG TPA: carboxypeptidase-like regulatory domain-containing protein [Planctomycetota bacterium]|nr:carboxypeptidase-like regulatory domain-containing protein [Planctomycetota bacterium]
MSTTQKTLGMLTVLLLLVAIWIASPPPEPRPAGAAEPARAAIAAEPVRAGVDAAVEAALRRVEAAPPAQPSEPDEPVALRGRVLDSRGQALPAVPVHACAFGQGGERFGGVLPQTETQSDAFGVFELTLGRDQVVVPMAGAGFCTLRTTPNQALRPGQEILLVAAPAVDLEGIVRGSDGVPLRDARAQVDTFFLEEFPLPLEHTVDRRLPAVATDADGRFTLPCTPLAAGVNLLFHRTGFESKRVPSLQAATGFLDVILASGAGASGRITGTVLDAAGHAVEGAELRLGEAQHTRSRADGTFEFDFPKRPSRLTAAHAGFQPVVREQVGKDTPMPLLLEFLAPALGISGRVVGADGVGLPGMLVNLLDPTRADAQSSLERLSAPPVELPHRALSRCDAEGRFAIAGLAARSYRLRAFDPDTLVCVQSEPIAAGSTDVVLVVPADLVLADFAGIVVDRDGRGLGGVAVGTSLLASMFDGVDSVIGPLATTDAEGRFVLHGLPRQHVRFVLTGDAFVATFVPIEDVLPDPEHRFEVLRRCFVQIEGPLGVEVAFADAAGAELWIESQTQDAGFSTNGWRMRTAKSPVLTLAETAAVMTWSRDGKELGRKTIVVEPGRDRVTTLVVGQ